MERGRGLPVGLVPGQSGHRRGRPVPGPEPESQPQKEDSGKPGPADGGRKFHSFSFSSDYHSPPANATAELAERLIGKGWDFDRIYRMDRMGEISPQRAQRTQRGGFNYEIRE